MSFGGFGGGSASGFGQTNNQSSGFGFGSNASATNTGFGSTATPAFGSTNAGTNTTGTGLFGGSTNTGFGSGGFGSGGFGSKPAFGTTTTTTGGTSLFGSTTATAPATGFGGGGFGSSTTATTTPFGGTSLFGGSKPGTGFGTTTTATTPFGGGATGTSLFSGGATTNTTSGFGATNNPGIGTNVGDPPGTNIVAFSAFNEKETNNPSQSNSYQNILFMDAYKKWSADELRLADYSQGRKQGGAGGSGAFGSSGFGTTGFGANTTTNTGFGSNTGGMFGSAQPAAAGFGASTTTATGGFGSGGGLFGSKPATGGLFGNSTAQPAQTGGLFGSNTATGGFGSNTNTTNTGFGATTNTTGTGLFGGASNNTAKPGGFSFGGSSGTGFGAASNTTTGGFGANPGTTNAGTGLFGGTAQTTPATGGLFGGAQQQQAPATGFGSTPFGGAAAQNTNTGGLFGSQPKSGLFGNAGANAATSSLFGGATNTATPFGTANTTQQAGGGLFGGAKPAASTGLFGTAPAAQINTTGGGLFGGLGTQNQTQQAGPGLFGGAQAIQQKPSLFGTQQTSGSSLFGGQPAQQQTSLFGPANTQQVQSGFGNSLLGASQNNQSQPLAFSTSITDLSAYGSATLFSGLPDDKIQNPGPLATPLSVKAKAKSRSILPMYKLSPANASRFATPQKRGFGFSYSNYGSPSSPSSVASTPGGLGQSLLGSIGRGLSKSISASNLRRSFNVEDSILTPGAFSASSSARLTNGSASHKRLVINRDMRSDLFTAPVKESLTPDATNGTRKLSKRVSFDTSTNENGAQDGPKALADGPPSTPEGSGLSRSANNGLSGPRPAPNPVAPEMEQVKNNELAIVPEEGLPAPVQPKQSALDEVVAGSYWTSPPLEELRQMQRSQLKAVKNFIVGRENIGSVEFKVPVDLSNINLDDIVDGIVCLAVRQATVYPNKDRKPPVGKGLNVPSLISLEHSYPRAGLGVKGRRLEKHIERLKAIEDTRFESYDAETGIWTFSVEHFTTYGLGEDDDEEEEEETDVDVTTDVNEHVAIRGSAAKASPEADPDDTFDFRRGRRAVPGAFDDTALSDDEQEDESRSLTAAHLHRENEPMQSQEWFEDESMAGAQDDYQYEASQHSSPHSSMDEQEDELVISRFAENEVQVPAGIMRARMRAVKKSTAPTKIEIAGGDDWTQILQASVRAPRTVDRATLRTLNETGAAWDMKDRGSPTPQKLQAADGPGFATSIDLMRSLFEQAKGPTQPVQASPATGFVKWPYQQRPKVDTEESVPVARPNWGPNELLVTAYDNETNMLSIDNSDAPSLSDRDLSQLQQYIESTLAESRSDQYGPDLRELAQGDSVWDLASILFDEDGVNLPRFWKTLVNDATNEALASTPTPEEKAIVCLAGNRVADACGHLLATGDFRLATLVSCIGAPKKDMRAQLKDWRDSNVLAEISEPIRAIYELLAGNAGVCAGVKNVPLEHRVASFTISQRFNLNWTMAFALRLYYTTTKTAGNGADVIEAVRSFQSDIEQDKEPEPNSPLWSLLKVFAFREFDWADSRLGWLLTRAIHSTGKVSFGHDAVEKLDRASIAFASALTTQSHWVPATFILLQLSDEASREAAVRDHLGRHAHLIGSPKKADMPFSVLRKFGVSENWIWEAKALEFRSKQDSRQEFLALVWAGNYTEANKTFLDSVGPDLVIERDLKRLFSYAQLLYKVRKYLRDWDRGAAVYLLYPMARSGAKQEGRFDDLLLDGLVALYGRAHGNVRQKAAVADMAEELIRSKGGDARLYQLLPEDVKGRYMRDQALDNIR